MSTLPPTVAIPPFVLPLPAKPGQRLRWHGLHGSAPALAIATLAGNEGKLVLVVTADSLSAQRLEDEIRFYAPPDLPLLHLPDWETLPYDMFSPHQDIISERLATLFHLPNIHAGILVAPVTTLLQRLPPVRFVQSHTLLLRQGERHDRETLRQRLEHSGYRAVRQVMDPGEFCVRGSVLDLFPMGSPIPFRIDWFDDTVDSIRQFDVESQRSRARAPEIRLLPAREFPLDSAALARFNQQWHAQFGPRAADSLLLRDVNHGMLPAGVEYYQPLFCDGMATLFDYLPSDAVSVLLPGVAEAAETFWREVRERYEQLRHDRLRPLLPPEALFMPLDTMFTQLNQHRQAAVADATQTLDQQNKLPAVVMPPPALPMDAKSAFPVAALQRFLAQFPGRVLFTAETTGRRENLRDLLHKHGIHPHLVDNWTAFLATPVLLATAEPICLTVARLEQGIVLMPGPSAPGAGLAVITEAQLLGERAGRHNRQTSQEHWRSQERWRSEAQRDPDAIIRNLTELEIGAPVVHEFYGVGRYLGLMPLEAGGITAEFLHLEYANGDKLYVPVTSLHLINRYSGVNPEHAPLHKLGSGQWEKARKKAQERVLDVAAELLDISARRAARQGHSFRHDPEAYQAFTQAFPFEETPDQQAAINAVLADMHSPRPMDRLVCGDVGFGKTEVAMRAAFVAAQDGRQVAVLVPTTLLAQQHFQTFSDRFADWPVRIELLSRFRSSKQLGGALQGIAGGSVDIVIGTHKLLQENIQFKNLGLVIIDEEHRFGVRQKEQFKKLRAEVDMLTLTATPIPRSLNFALAALRDLSIIATPPSKRLAIKTFVSQWNNETLSEALLRELKRGGQVFFVHNRVEDIGKIANQVEALLPEARVEVAHGQMPERQLERVMSDFYHRRFNVLVCTTIIETGIDIPSANTIIINRADCFGLAQLHQLRGRVGRSHHRAYAYLIVPPHNAMTPDAVRRIEALAQLEDLGMGYALATQDMEIRGAGELLGDEQSGHMHALGYSLYAELLERAVGALKSGRAPELDRPLNLGAEVDLRSPALLPQDYLPDVHARLILYKRIAAAPDADALRDLRAELIDRFGLLPPPALTLFDATEIKLKAAPLGIRKIELGENGGRMLFISEPPVQPSALIQLVHSNPRQFRPDKENNLRINAELPTVATRVELALSVLERLGGEGFTRK